MTSKGLTERADKRSDRTYRPADYADRWAPKASVVSSGRWLAWDRIRLEPLIDRDTRVVQYLTHAQAEAACADLNKRRHVNPMVGMGT